VIPRPRRRRSPRRLFRLIAIRLVPALAALVAAAAAYPVLRGHTEPAFGELARARAALEEARRAGMAGWAASELAAAEEAFRAASAEHRRQEVRFRSLRDFREVRKSLAAVEAMSEKATAVATARRTEADEECRAAVRDAERAIGAATEFAEAMPLGKAERASYLRARMALEEARAHRRDRRWAQATAAARESRKRALEVTRRAAVTASRFGDEELVDQWRRWTRETIAWSRRTGETAIVVDKQGHTLEVYDGGRLVKTYAAELGTNWTADKSRSGDAATPEGRYKVLEKKGSGQSIYHKALLLDYPNAEDRAAFERAKRRGDVPRNSTPGGLIEIHGEGGKGRDWTRGCVAVSNVDMDEVFRHAKVGTPVTIVGSNDHGGELATLAARHENGAAGSK
jgi:L,D-peptidoglycan transpeptidase YkuD (ErfK/YbiS/YcfS/YnhG family)